MLIFNVLHIFIDTWIVGNFPIGMWNVHGESRRTNNDLEGWHAGFNKRVEINHPNIWRMINILKMEQATTAAIKLQVAAGQNLVRRNRKYELINQRIQLITQNYQGGIIQQDEFLQGIAYNLHQ